MISMIAVTLSGREFLSVETFPKTYDDLSAEQKIEIQTEGYEPYAGLSPYQFLELITAEEQLQKELEMDRLAEELEKIRTGANQEQPSDQQNTPSGNNTDGQKSDSGTTNKNDDNKSNPNTVQPNNNSDNGKNADNSNNSNTPQNPPSSGGGTCSNRNPDIPAGQKLPLGSPVRKSDMPVHRDGNKYYTCSRFGWRKMGSKNDYHYGFDIGCGDAWFGKPVYSPADGTVVMTKAASECKSAGNYVKVQHDNGFVTYYMHLESITVQKGQKISAGCQVGTLGHSGGAKVQKCPKMGKNISHLHYQLEYSGNQSSIQTPKGSIRVNRGNPPKKTNAIDPADFIKYNL